MEWTSEEDKLPKGGEFTECMVTDMSSTIGAAWCERLALVDGQWTREDGSRFEFFVYEWFIRHG